MRLLSLVCAVLATSAGAVPFPSRLVVASGLRVRDSAHAGAAVVERVAIGTILPCLEQSSPVRVGATTGPLCRTRIEGGREGWFFAPLTAELEADVEAQLGRLVAQKMAELQGAGEDRLSDVYDLHQFLRRRIDAAQDGPGRMRAKLDELRFVQAHPEAFHADPRVYRDEAQGLRLRREALWSLVEEARGTPTAEAAAWLAVEHGPDLECEGSAPCEVSWLTRIECEYLARFPTGAHAAQVSMRIRKLADRVAQEPVVATSAEELLPLLEQVRRCLATAKGSSAGDARRALARAAAVIRRAGVKAAPHDKQG